MKRSLNILSVLIVFFMFFQIDAIAASDLKKAKIRLDKISDFNYNYYIDVEFVKDSIINEPQTGNPDNFIITVVGDQNKSIKVQKVEVLVSGVALYAELNQNEKYLLSVKEKALRYKVDSSYVKAGQCKDTLIFSEKQKPYLALTPVFKIDISPISTSQITNGTLYLDFNFEISGPIKFIDSSKVFGSFNASGIATSNFDSTINNITFSGKFKYSLFSDWYVPLQVEVKNERTEDFKESDYAVSVGLASLIPIPNLHLTKTQFSPFPELSINYEAVFQQTSNVLGTNRLTSKLNWYVPIGDDFTLNIAVNGVMDINNMSSKNLKDFYNVSLNHKVSDVVSALIKYVKGSLPPVFNQIPASYLVGFNFKF